MIRLVGPARQFCIGGRNIVASQYAHENAVRRRHRVAYVGQFAAGDLRARNMRVDHRVRCALRLVPVHLAEATESSGGRPPAIPLHGHGNRDSIVRSHRRPPRSRRAHSTCRINRTHGSGSNHPIEGGQIKVFDGTPNPGRSWASTARFPRLAETARAGDVFRQSSNRRTD